MKKLVVVVDGPPVPKGRPRFTGKWAFTPPRTREFERRVRDALVAAVAKADWPTGLEYRLRIAVYRARKQGDAINFAVSIQDAANGVLYDDDRQVQHLEVQRFDDKDNPRVLIDIEAIRADTRDASDFGVAV